MEVRLIDYTTNSLAKIATCAREAYQSFDSNKSTDEQLVETMLRAGDLSPFEHANITFRIIGASRVATHQIVRHRMASYTQESQKFAPQDDAFVMPEGVYGLPYYLINQHYKQSLALYNELIDVYGVNKDSARYVLPAAKTSNIIVTINFRSLINFFQQRTCGKASVEMQRIASAMKIIAQDICSAIFMRDFAPCEYPISRRCPKPGKCNYINRSKQDR